jgi:lysine N6-hydroxylase
MPPEKVYDIIGIGIGPFNLGLAALCHTIPNLHCLFIDENESFNWHPGLLLPGTTLQVPWYADLVTLADPCHPFIYMKYLQAKKKMFRFAIAENYFIKRTTYNAYCQWVAAQLPSLQFSTTCISIEKENNFYRVKTSKGQFLAQHIVLGTGTRPCTPPIVAKLSDRVFHSAHYLFRKEHILQEDSITIVGSGQSAAEIFYDLLQSYQGKLSWFTRSPRFMPMDYSKLALEFSTPDYIDHFFALPDRKKQTVLKTQEDLYKGVNHSLIASIYDLLDETDSGNIQLHTNCELTKLDATGILTFRHTELEKTFTHESAITILATGYKPVMPACIKPLRRFIHLTADDQYKANRNYSIDDANTIFIQNAEHATHGFNAPDLSLGPYRNAIILNSILGYEHFSIETGITFQSFGIPS